jgi:D-serine deaminase-like pyridoxal phosphate-dependent protein
MLVTRVISKPGPDLVCLDLGYKGVSPDNPDQRVWFPELPDAAMVVHSEEHLVVRSPGADILTVGSVLYGVPFHVCPTTALYRDLIVIRDRSAVERWPVTARDRMLAI